MRTTENGTPTEYEGVFRLSKGTYRVRKTWRDERTGRREQIERRISAATDRAAWLEMQRLADEAVSEGANADRLRAGDCARLWLAQVTPGMDPGTKRNALTAMSALMGDPETKRPGDLGWFFADALTADDVQAWVSARLADGYARSTVAGWLAKFRSMVRARRRDFTDRFWFDLVGGCVRLPTPERKPAPYAPTEEQVDNLVDWIRRTRAFWFPLVHLKLVTGQRFEHVAALRWEDLDRDALALRFERKVYKGVVAPINAIKAAPPVLPITHETLAILDEHRRYLIATEHPGVASGWIFPGRKPGRKGTTGPVWISDLYDVWRDACWMAGIDASRFTQHDTRGHVYDRARRRGVAEDTIQAIVGHSQERMRALYSTVALEEQREAVARMTRKES